MTTQHFVDTGKRSQVTICIRRITLQDIATALARGWGDFLAQPSHYGFAVLIYPVIGWALFIWASQGNAWYLVYPLAAGFALLGPIAALGLYEISRRRELGLDSSWRHCGGLIHSPAIPAISLLALWLLALFLSWMFVAQMLYLSLFTEPLAAGAGALLGEILSTTKGWQLLIVGHLIGLCFASVALATTVIAFPLLLDLHISAAAAVAASVLATVKNPLPVLAWCGCVAVLLLLGSLLALAGLIVALPVLGHATWHLYRQLVQVERPDAGDYLGQMGN